MFERLIRDRLCFWMLMVIYAVIFFAVFSLFATIDKFNIQIKDGRVYRECEDLELLLDYNCNDFGEDVNNLVALMENIKANKVELGFTIPSNDDAGYSDIWIEFTNEYMDGVDKHFVDGSKIFGVYIGETLLNEAVKMDGKKYINICGQYYLVNGVYNDNSFTQNDKRIVFPWKTMRNNQRKYMTQVLANRVANMMAVHLRIQSNTDLSGCVTDISDFVNQSNFTFIPNMEGESEEVEYGKIFAIIGTFMVIFSTVACYNVTSMLMRRRREEMAIRRTWGESCIKIYLGLAIENMFYIACAIPLSLILLAVYSKAFKERISVDEHMVVLYLFTVLTLVILALVMALFSVINVSKIKLIKVIKNNE